jgi:Sortilin, neurotensin receptor 3,
VTVATPPRRAETEHDRDLEQRVADLEALIEEARRRTRRRRRKYGAAVLLATLVGVATFIVFDRSASGSQDGLPASPRSAASSGDSVPADFGGFVSAFAFDPSAPATVYVATSADGGDHGGRVYKTTDGGKHWRSTTTSDWTRVDALAADPRHPGTLYAGTGLAVFKTVNGGQSWHGASRGLFRGPPNIGPAPANRRRYGWVTALAVDPIDSDNVYAGTATGIRKSSDGGATWTTVLRPGRWIFGSAFVITPSRPQVVYVAASIVGPTGCGVNVPTHCGPSNWLYASANGGKTWRRTQLPLASAGSSDILAADPLQPTTLYLAHTRHLLTSTDAGASWESIVGGTPNRDVSGLAVDPRRSGTAYLVEGLNGDVLKTTDGGHAWTQLSLLGSPVLAFALDPARPETIYAAIDSDHRNRILISTDGGHTWATVR